MSKYRKSGLRRSTLLVSEVFNEKTHKWIIFFYLLISSLPLFYPTIIVEKLWNPPVMDISNTWNAGLGVSKDVIGVIIENIKNIMFSFYLISLFSFRKSYGLVILIGLPYYFEYCASGYIGRTAFGIVLFFLFISLWFSIDKNKNKILMILVFIFSIPVILVIMYIWGAARSGMHRVNFNYSFDEMILILIENETSFPIYSKAVLSSGENADLISYFSWILTLPFPKILIGTKPTFVGNVEIAEIIGGITQGTEGFSVTLTGPVTESFYLYGTYLFWIHPLTMGLIAGILCYITVSNKKLLFIYSFLVLAFSYIFMRAGVGGLMPIIINQFIGFYILILYCYFKKAN